MHRNPALVIAAHSPERMLAAQTLGLAAADKWRARDDVTALSALLSHWDHNPPENVEAMAGTVQPWLADQSWLGDFPRTMIAALRQDPLAALQFSMVQGRVTHGLVLLQTRHCEVTLNWIDAQKLPLARDQHVLLTSALSILLVVSGSGLRVVTHALESGVDQRLRSSTPRRIASGEVLAINCRQQAVSMHDAQADAVLVRINVKLPSTAGQRAFAIAGGQPVAMAMGDDGACRMLPLLAIARLAGKPARAAAVLTELTNDEDRTLRWAAMRELLVADTHAALPILRAMAQDDPDASIRRTADATERQLLLRENSACPA
jgi:hypothetical protein